MFHVRNPNCRIAFWLVFTLLGQCERGYSDVVHNPPSAHCEVDATTGQCVIEENNEKIMSDPDHLDENHNHDQCTLYMAVSTIPGAGLGIFTGTERKVGDTIGNGDVMIAITDHWYHLKATIAPYSRLDWLHIDPMFDYVWNGAGLGMQRESAHSYAEGIEYVLGYAPGIDAAINCHQGLINVDKSFPVYDFVGLHRSKDPGVGAFTPYHRCQTLVLHDIPAGGELFKNYGDDWFKNREHRLGRIPFKKDYLVAEVLLKRLHRLLEKGKISEAARSDLWKMLKDGPWSSTRTFNAIPPYEKLEVVVNQSIRAAYQPRATRTLADLDKNGRCIDNIRPQPSTIRQAGRGAFATRFLPEGTSVTGTPLIFFPAGDYFKMYEGDWFTKAIQDFRPDILKGYQLLINYCWHHENASSIYLCPYGSGVNYINHNKTKANVRLQWAEDGQMNHNASLLEKNPTEMYYTAAPNLWMDVVATRDIHPDEELFLDYGDVWDKAWHDHVERWETNADYPADYISARDWNLQNPSVVLRTEDEQKNEPYPENFRLTCLPEISEEPKNGFQLTPKFAQELWHPSVIGFPCHIVNRRIDGGGRYLYKVRYLYQEEDVPLFVEEKDEQWEMSDWIVREAMQFVDAPYSNNVFLSEVFRHPFGFPDNIFPKAWRGVFIPPLPDLNGHGSDELQH